MGITRSERKEWAKEVLRGVENVTMPSFTPDFRDLDEAGIRWDVDRAVEHGFASTMCAVETGLTLTLTRQSFVSAIHAIRRNLYRGDTFETFDTQALWMHEEIALPFRFIKQQLASRPELPTMDGLYMFERAVAV